MTSLQQDVAALKTQLSHLKATIGVKPFIPTEVNAPAPAAGADVPPTGESLPLKLGPMGPLATGRIFDTKIAGQPVFQFSSHKGGDQWKGKTESYLMSVVPAVHAIFAWAEKQEVSITQARYEEAIGRGLTTYDREGFGTDHSFAINSAIWGFLSKETCKKDGNYVWGFLFQ